MGGLDSRSLEPGQDIWYHLREQIKIQAGGAARGLPAGSPGLGEAEYLDVRGAAGWTRDPPGGCAHQL